MSNQEESSDSNNMEDSKIECDGDSDSPMGRNESDAKAKSIARKRIKKVGKRSKKSGKFNKKKTLKTPGKIIFLLLFIYI